MNTHTEIKQIADRLHHLFKNDNYAPQWFTDYAGDTLKEHGWKDLKTAEADDIEFRQSQKIIDDMKDDISTLEKQIRELENEAADIAAERDSALNDWSRQEDRITELEQQLHDLTLG